MRLLSLEVQNYRNICAARLEPGRELTVICGNNENRDICGLGTAKTHCCESLMSRSIKECDLLTFDIDNISTDMLGDTASFPCCYMCITDCVQNRCFTMVNMTHNTDNRWSWL